MTWPIIWAHTVHSKNYEHRSCGIMSEWLSLTASIRQWISRSCNYNLVYIGIIIFPHIDDIQSTDYNEAGLLWLGKSLFHQYPPGLIHWHWGNCPSASEVTLKFTGKQITRIHKKLLYNHKAKQTYVLTFMGCILYPLNSDIEAGLHIKAV